SITTLVVKGTEVASQRDGLRGSQARGITGLARWRDEAVWVERAHRGVLDQVVGRAVGLVAASIDRRIDQGELAGRDVRVRRLQLHLLLLDAGDDGAD